MGSHADAVTYVDVCQVKACPHPNSEEWHHPICGHGLAGHHHHVVKRSQGGKEGMQVFICPRCHDRIDNGRWSNAVVEAHDGDKVRWDYYIFDTMGKQVGKGVDVTRWVVGEGDGRANDGGEVSVPAAGSDALGRGSSSKPLDHHAGHPPVSPSAHILVPDNDWIERQALKAQERPQDEAGRLPTCVPQRIIGGKFVDVSPALSYEGMSDEELAVLYEQADSWQREAFVRKCLIVAEFRRRHQQAWGESWVSKPLELLPEPPSRRTLAAWANLGEIFADTAQIEHVGKLSDSRSLMAYIGAKALPEAREAMAAAVQHVADYGEVPTVPALAHILGEEAKPECEHIWGIPRLRVQCVYCNEWQDKEE